MAENRNILIKHKKIRKQITDMTVASLLLVNSMRGVHTAANTGDEGIHIAGVAMNETMPYREPVTQTSIVPEPDRMA